MPARRQGEHAVASGKAAGARPAHDPIARRTRPARRVACLRRAASCIAIGTIAMHARHASFPQHRRRSSA